MWKNYLVNCVSALREDWAKFADRGNQYERWLECRATAARLDACNVLIAKQLARKKDEDFKRFIREKQGRQRKAVAALAVFRDRGLISARNFKEIDGASRAFNNGWFADLYEDALQLLRSGRVRPGTQLFINPRPGIDASPAPTGERSADIAFVDARSGRRVVRFSHMSSQALAVWIGHGEIPNALAWVAEQPDARSIEVVMDLAESYPAYELLAPHLIKAFEGQLGKRMPRGLEKIPLLVQGDTSVSYERWLALATRFRARGLDTADRDDPTLARLVTLADLERDLGAAR